MTEEGGIIYPHEYLLFWLDLHHAVMDGIKFYLAWEIAVAFMKYFGMR